VCALGYYLERAGFMTTGISLVRENAASLQPPRTLWVSFPLGRPLGVPNDPPFQQRVIAAALDLLARKAGPVLEDYPEDAPEVAIDEAPACPVSFRSDATTWHGRLTAELANLAPWHDIGQRRRGGRTLVGVCESDIEEIIRRLAADLDAERLPDDLRWFKAAIEDAKAYYVEALTAQPGKYDPRQTYAALWQKTQLGAGLRWFYDRFRVHPGLKGFARIVLPRDAVASTSGTSASNNMEDSKE
jgi:D-proline reductase (dithiol) PrdB